MQQPKGYRGEVRELKDIEPGTPVEVLDRGQFTYRGIDPTAPLVGILTMNSESLYDAKNQHVRVQVMDGGKWTHIDPMSYHGLPKSSKVFKVLTGVKAQQLLAARKAHAIESLQGTLWKSVSFNMGSDPEIFVADGAGKLLPAYKFLPDKATSPMAFWDGFQAEFTFGGDSCNCRLMDQVRLGMLRVLKAAQKVDPKAQLILDSVVEVDPEELVNAAPEHVALGCSPSKNAYGLKGLKPPDCRMLRHRFAGGHIHLGATVPTDVNPWVRAIDAIAGVASVGMFAGYENPIRRKFYGLPGEYRLPKHGLEYRTLPNTWLSHPAVALLVWDLVRAAVWVEEAKLMGMWEADQEEVIRVIGESDVNAAREMIRRNEKFFLALTRWVCEQAVIVNLKSHHIPGAPDKDPVKYADAALKLVMEGLDACVEEPRNLTKNWMLDRKESVYPSYRPGQVVDASKNASKYYYSTETWTPHTESKDKQWYQAAHTIMGGGKI